MNEDECAVIYNRLINECSKHSIPSDETKKFMETETEQVNNLKISMAELKTDLKNFGDKLGEHINDQKQNDKKVDDNFEKVFQKIDHLGDTFQSEIQDKADQKEIVSLVGKLDDKYASKRTEWLVYIALLGLIGLLISMLGFFIKNLEIFNK